jgi:hypothetical protein
MEKNMATWLQQHFWGVDDGILGPFAWTFPKKSPRKSLPTELSHGA